MYANIFLKAYQYLYVFMAARLMMIKCQTTHYFFPDNNSCAMPKRINTNIYLVNGLALVFVLPNLNSNHDLYYLAFSIQNRSCQRGIKRHEFICKDINMLRKCQKHLIHMHTTSTDWHTFRHSNQLIHTYDVINGSLGMSNKFLLIWICFVASLTACHT